MRTCVFVYHSTYSVIIALDIKFCAGGSACCCCLLGQFISRPIIRRCSPGNHWVPKTQRERWATLLTEQNKYLGISIPILFYNLITIVIGKPVISSAPLAIFRASCFFCTYLFVYIYPKIETRSISGWKLSKICYFHHPESFA